MYRVPLTVGGTFRDLEFVETSTIPSQVERSPPEAVGIAPAYGIGMPIDDVRSVNTIDL